MTSDRSQLESALAQLDDQVEGFKQILGANDAALWAEPTDGEWSAAMVLVHVSDAEVHVAARLRYLLTEDSPTFPDWKEQEHAALSATRSPEIALAVIASLSASNADLVRVVEPTRLTRTATLPDGEDVDAIGLLERHVRHCAAHLEQANAALAAS